MAVTKIKALKSTLRKAIDYIINPEKTDLGKWVYSFGCMPATADIEMQLTAQKGRKVGNRVAYHLIQSFAPDDPVTQELAFEIGKKYAQEITNGQYEYIIATHGDREHLHNHIIFNSTSFVTKNKYHYRKNDKFRIQEISDKLCRENGLSVIETTSGIRGASAYEYKQKTSNLSWKENIQKAIDEAISKAATFEEFLEMMKMEGYEIKSGKHIAFRAMDQERFTRGKRIGENYTEEAIRNRILNKENEIKVPESETISKPKMQKMQKKKKFDSKRINLIVDISNNVKAQRSGQYKQALYRVNIDILVKSMNFLIANNITTPEDFIKYKSAKMDEYEFLHKDINRIKSEMIDISEKIKYTQNYKGYVSSGKEGIILYKAALIYFERKHLNPETINLNELFEDLKLLKQEKVQISSAMKRITTELNELQIIEKNIESALSIRLSEQGKNENGERRKSDYLELKGNRKDRDYSI